MVFGVFLWFIKEGYAAGGDGLVGGQNRLG